MTEEKKGSPTHISITWTEYYKLVGCQTQRADLLEALKFIKNDNLPTLLSEAAQKKLDEAIQKAEQL